MDHRGMDLLSKRFDNFFSDSFTNFVEQNKINEDQVGGLLDRFHQRYESDIPQGQNYKTFNMHNVKAEDIQLSLAGNKIHVEAVEKSIGMERTLSYSFMLPPNADPNTIKSTLDGKRGLLKLEWEFKGKAPTDLF